jgi:hypothetical protein
MTNFHTTYSFEVFQGTNHSIDFSEYTLRDKLIAAQRTSGFDSMQFFLPANKLHWLISNETFKVNLESELERHSLSPISGDFIQFIINDAPKDFATLVYSRLTPKIQDFFEVRFDDTRLPVECDTGTGLIRFPTGTPTPRGHPYSLEDYANVFASWKPTEINEFCDNQWRFNCLQSIWNDDVRYGLDRNSSGVPWFHPRTIFPFKVLDRPKGTPFSKVWKVEDISGYGDDSPRPQRVRVFFPETLEYLNGD